VNSLSRGGRVSRVRLAGLSGLSSDRAKPLTQAGLNLIPLFRVGLGRVNLRFSFINSNSFDLNSNLNYDRLLHVKQNTGALHYSIKYAAA
jgi:hypothetical protein